jgi:hypothetical protein
VATDTRHDAAERRITELYTKAADQLGSAKAPVRLAGLYALERLAQGNPTHRQTIVDVICAYLWMPFTLPRSEAPDSPRVETGDGHQGADTPTTDPAGHPAPSPSDTSPTDPAPEPTTADRRTAGTLIAAAEAREETQVRLTAQRVLGAHLCRPADTSPEQATVLPAEHPFWPDLHLGLTDAALIVCLRGNVVPIKGVGLVIQEDESNKLSKHARPSRLVHRDAQGSTPRHPFCGDGWATSHVFRKTVATLMKAAGMAMTVGRVARAALSGCPGSLVMVR